MKYSLNISNFLEEIFRLPSSNVFLYFLALITQGAILVSPFYFLEFCIQMGVSFLFSFAFSLSSFLSCAKSAQTATLPYCISLFWGIVLITASCTMSLTSVHSSSGTLSIRPNPLNLFVTSHCIIERDLI